MAGIYAAKGQDWIRSQVAVVMPVRRQREGERERGKSRKSRPTFSQVVDLEPRHLLGEDGLGQVEQSRVVYREVAVVLVQDPHGRPLDAGEHTVTVSMARHQHGSEHDTRLNRECLVCFFGAATQCLSHTHT